MKHGINLDYITLAGTITYYTEKPMGGIQLESEEFPIDDETVMKAHKFSAENAIKYASMFAAEEDSEKEAA